MRIIILHPSISPDATLEDHDTMVQVEAVSQALDRLGHRPAAMPCTLDLAAVRRELLQERPDMVFNLVESMDGSDCLQYVPAALLDALAMPYTGAPTEAIFQTTHKLLAKQLLHLSGLPTPAWKELRVESPELRVESRESSAGPRRPHPSPLPEGEGTMNNPAACSAPWIIKAVWEHASRGLEEGNIVPAGAQESLPQRLQAFRASSGRPCFAEQFIEGREFNLSVLGGSDGPEVLPCAEIDFSAFPPGKPRIVGHRAKWEADSFEFHNTPRQFEFPPADAELLAQMQELARACWRLFGLRGYARVDFRVDRQGRPWILEVNTNPCLSPDAGFAAAIERAGLGYDGALGRIIADGNGLTRGAGTQ